MSDRLYVAETNDGTFGVGAGIWKEGDSSPIRIGNISAVHDDHIIGRLTGADESVRFDFVGERFDDDDGDRSQEIVQHAAQAKEEQPEQPFEPIANETLFISLHGDGSINNGFSSVWKHVRDGEDDKLVCRVAATIKKINEDHIIVNFRDNGSLATTDVRLNITNNKFKDCNGDNAVEVIVVPAQPDIQVGQYAFENGKFFGRVVKGDDEHIRIDGLNGCKCWFSISDDTKQRFKFHTIEPGMWLAPKTSGISKLIKHIVPGGEKFPIVVMEDGGSIYFDGAIKYYDILTQEQHDARSSHPPPVKVAHLQPILSSMDKWHEKLPKLVTLEHLFVFKDGKCVGKVTSSSGIGGTWFIDHTDTLRPISVDEHEFLTIKPGLVIGQKQGVDRTTYTIGAVSLGNGHVEPHLVTTNNRLITLSDFAANWMVAPRAFSMPDLGIDLQTTSADLEFPPAQPQPQPLEIGTIFKFRTLPDRWRPFSPQNCLDNTFTVIKHHDSFKGEGQCVTRNDFAGCIFSLLFGVLPSDDIEILPAQQPVDLDPKPRGNHESRIEQPAQQHEAQDEVFDEYGCSLRVGYDVFYKVSGELCGKITKLHEDNQITMVLACSTLNSIVPCYNPRVDAGDGQVWGFCPSNWGASNADRILRIDRFEGGTAHKLSPIQLSKRISEIAENVLPKYLPVEKTAEKEWVVDDEFETQIHVGDAVFLKETGKVIGHVTKLRDDNQLDIKFRHDSDLGSIRCYNPRMLLRERRFGFHQSGQFGDDLDRVGYILDLEKKQLAEQKEALRKLQVEQAGDGCRHGIPKSRWKICLRCNSSSRWQPSIRPEYGTDFCAKCMIWWTSSDIGKPIVDSKILEPSSVKPAQQPAHAKLKECDVTDTDAWLSRNRPPVDLHNGDTIVTTTGIYRLYGNKWVKVGGNLRVRSRDPTQHPEAVEYKFICDALPEDSSDDACTEKIYIPIHGDHMDTVRPKKPLSLGAITRKHLENKMWASILKGNAEDGQRSED